MHGYVTYQYTRNLRLQAAVGFIIIQIIILPNSARLRNSLIIVDFAFPRYLRLKIIQIIVYPNSAGLRNSLIRECLASTSYCKFYNYLNYYFA